uniref:Uncharacterized protein n=1 Tax=Lotus japonicus TaxID=34305 RepID=I3SA56_LOTJA|nr:unknown [Lotus japonicus]
MQPFKKEIWPYLRKRPHLQSVTWHSCSEILQLRSEIMQSWNEIMQLQLFSIEITPPLVAIYKRVLQDAKFHVVSSIYTILSNRYTI